MTAKYKRMIEKQLASHRYEHGRYATRKFCEGYHELFNIVLEMAKEIERLEGELNGMA